MCLITSVGIKQTIYTVRIKNNTDYQVVKTTENVFLKQKKYGWRLLFFLGEIGSAMLDLCFLFLSPSNPSDCACIVNQALLSI